MTTGNAHGRDHGGGVDAAVARWGGVRADWIDLSTGINPEPYPVGSIDAQTWQSLPDQRAFARLQTAARRFWTVPDGASVLAAPGASALIARLPAIAPDGPVVIPGPTYNEHAAAFRAAGREVREAGEGAVRVLVHPNNPDGRIWSADELGTAPLTIIDESFCDVMPAQSHIARTAQPGTVVLKSFGKFWGLAGLRLGFAIGHPDTLGAMSDLLGPWAVSGPALGIGARALDDMFWASATRERLTGDARRLDTLMTRAGAKTLGGTTLFRLYRVDDAAAWQDRLAAARIWSRIFPYSDTWLRLGLPPASGWDRLEKVL